MEVQINNLPTYDAESIFKNINKNKHIKSPFRKWIVSQLSGYGFIESTDFWKIISESTGGRPKTKYFLSANAVEHICMIDKSKEAMALRQKYISLREETEKHNLKRMVGIETRKSLTDKIKDAGENERMHGHGYSTYTKLVYKLAGIKYIKQDNFRSTLSSDELERVETIEKMVDAFLKMGKQYNDIKSNLDFIFRAKEIEA